MKPTYRGVGSARPSLFLPICLFLAFLSVGFYLLISYLQNGAFGFPLDDAWIHQVYARNLGTRFEFSFFAGQPSAGSTSPLWAILLSISYALSLDFRVWTILLGIVFLGASGFLAGRVTRHLTGNAHAANWFAPLFLLFEWHMVWAAASGMEILLFVSLSLALVEGFFERRNVLWLGFLAGLLTLTRPEGIVFAGLVGFGLTFQGPGPSTTLRFRSLALYVLTFLILLAPYLYFNLQVSGAILPNTFYAKAAEYAELTRESLFARWLRLYRQPFIGAQLLLVPGLLYGGWKLARARNWDRLLPAVWIVLLPSMYAWRLPVEYQFGRYLMPIMPFVVIYGIAGTATLFERVGTMTVLLRVILRAWGAAIAVLLFAFYLLGANLYAQSVAVIQCEMVAVAKWTATNLPQGGLLAAHDIGAQEYFDPRPMLDMAGLVSPEVIPFIRDEMKLMEWMQARGAKYVVFFPTWYPQLSRDARLHEIFSTGCTTTRSMGEENLRVFEVQ